MKHFYAGDAKNYSFRNMSYYNGKLAEGEKYMGFQRVDTTKVHYHAILQSC